MGKFFVLVLVCVAIFFAVRPTSSDPVEEAKNRATAEAANRLIQMAIDDYRRSNVVDFDITPFGDRNSETHYAVHIEYPPTSRVAAQCYYDQDCLLDPPRAIVRSILTKLVALGRRPSQEHIFIDALVWQRKLGETGRTLYRDLGSVIYDYNDDRIVNK